MPKARNNTRNFSLGEREREKAINRRRERERETIEVLSA